MKTYSQFIEEAEKRLKFTRFTRGTTKTRDNESKKTGKLSRTSFGTLGPGHYVTHSKKKAEKYAEINAKQRNDKPAVVHYRVPSKKVHDVDGIPKGTTTKNPETPKGKTVIRNKRSGHSVITQNAEKYRIKNPEPVIRRKRKSQ